MALNLIPDHDHPMGVAFANGLQLVGMTLFEALVLLAITVQVHKARVLQEPMLGRERALLAVSFVAVFASGTASRGLL
jgi:hypothetical protein